MNYIKFICLAVLFISLGLATAGGCGSSGGGENGGINENSPPEQNVNVTTPALLTPINDDVIQQNNPNIGCPLDPFSGYGSRIFFDWIDSESPYGISGYHLYVIGGNAIFPIIDTFVSESEYTDTRCNSFVIDRNLSGWMWTVQAEDNRGNLSQVASGEFRYEPCRLEDERTCSSPPFPVNQPEPVTDTDVTAPVLLTPVNNDVIEQNNPNIGCPFNQTFGFGHRIFFDWTDSESPNGIRGYRLFVIGSNAIFPIVDTFVSESEYTDISCNSFVADQNLEDWMWSVQAEDFFGNLSPAAEGTFRFEPCRHTNGTPCFSL